MLQLIVSTSDLSLLDALLTANDITRYDLMQDVILYSTSIQDFHEHGAIQSRVLSFAEWILEQHPESFLDVCKYIWLSRDTKNIEFESLKPFFDLLSLFISCSETEICLQELNDAVFEGSGALDVALEYQQKDFLTCLLKPQSQLKTPDNIFPALLQRAIHLKFTDGALALLDNYPCLAFYTYKNTNGTNGAITPISLILKDYLSPYVGLNYDGVRLIEVLLEGASRVEKDASKVSKLLTSPLAPINQWMHDKNGSTALHYLMLFHQNMQFIVNLLQYTESENFTNFDSLHNLLFLNKAGKYYSGPKYDFINDESFESQISSTIKLLIIYASHHELLSTTLLETLANVEKENTFYEDFKNATKIEKLTLRFTTHTTFENLCGSIVLNSKKRPDDLLSSPQQKSPKTVPAVIPSDLQLNEMTELSVGGDDIVHPESDPESEKFFELQQNYFRVRKKCFWFCFEKIKANSFGLHFFCKNNTADQSFKLLILKFLSQVMIPNPSKAVITKENEIQIRFKEDVSNKISKLFANARQFKLLLDFFTAIFKSIDDAIESQSKIANSYRLKFTSWFSLNEENIDSRLNLATALLNYILLEEQVDGNTMSQLLKDELLSYIYKTYTQLNESQDEIFAFKNKP